MKIKNKKVLDKKLAEAIDRTPIIDIHTHLFSPDFMGLFLWGIDELLTYHYLTAEFFTYETKITPSQFYQLDKKDQADMVWKKLFIENTPLSEAARGVITVLHLLGIDPHKGDLSSIRKYFSGRSLEKHIDNLFSLANIDHLIMTNNPFDNEERGIWLGKGAGDGRFQTALRLDDLFFNFAGCSPLLKEEGFNINKDLNNPSVSIFRKFFDKWIKIMKPLYLMCSLPPQFRYPEKDGFTTRLIDKVIIPVMKEHHLPLALMFGVKRGVNPGLGLAGDGLGRSDLNTIINFPLLHPEAKFLVTVLSRENIHETAVAARKFNNMRLFGCWWFTNIPVLIEEIVRIRMELLGTNFIPQHSDARVFEQVLYKWHHFKIILKKILMEKYSGLMEKGRPVTEENIKRDIKAFYQDRFTEFIKF